MKSQPSIVKGTPLEAKALKQGKIFSVTYKPRLRYEWDTGAAIGRYLKGFKEGRLMARSCQQCNRVMIPPRIFCERCFRPTDDWVEVQDRGKILTYSLCYVTWEVKRLKNPQIPAVIEIDGASPGMGILHVVQNVAPKKVRVGMAVRAVWKPKSKRIGSVTDIAFWEPTKN